MHSGIKKANISDHFPMFTILENSCNKNKNYKKTKITKQGISNENIQNFQFMLENMNWDQYLPSNAPNEAYNIFFESKKEIEIKRKYLSTPWITKGIRKSFKRKQRLYEKYEKYLKIRSKENEKSYKTYKDFFERIKQNAKKNYFRDKVKLFENEMRNT